MRKGFAMEPFYITVMFLALIFCLTVIALVSKNEDIVRAVIEALVNLPKVLLPRDKNKTK
jgi:hypothetical protein